MSSTTTTATATSGSEKKHKSAGPASSTVLSEFDAEYACSDHLMVRQVVQAVVRNYFSASCTSPAHMTLCIDFTEGAPVPSNSSPFVRYQAPLVQINVQRKPGGSDSAIVTTARSRDASTSETADRRKKEQKQCPLLQAAKKLAVYTIKEEEEDLKPLKAVTRELKTLAPVQKVQHLKCEEKKTAVKREFEYLPISYKRLLSKEKIEEWRRRYEEDKRELYTDKEATVTKSSPSASPETARSETITTTRREAGAVTEDQRTSDWGPVAGGMEFEPPDEKGNISKGIQLRGNAPAFTL